MQGYSIPETTRAYGAVLLNADGEEFTDSLGPRDVVAQAIVDEVAKGKGVETPDGRPAVYLDTTRIAEARRRASRCRTCCAATAAAGIDPLAEPILTYPVLHYQNGGLVIDTDAETTLEGLYACGEIAGGTHGRNRMMGNSLLECVVFGRRAGEAAARRRAHERRHRRPICSTRVEDAAAHLYVWALKDIPQDLRDALAAARERETSVPGRRVLETIHRNVNVADSEKNLVCQDTGIAVYTCRVGEHFPLHPARIYEALRDGTARATVEHPLRSNAVHTITRENTGPNIGYRLPIVHWEFVDGLGRARREVRAEGLGLREHELPEDVRPRRRREGDQAVRARVDRRRRRQAVPAGDRRRRHRRLRRLRDVPREGGDHAADRHAQRRPDRRAARGRAVRAC